MAGNDCTATNTASHLRSHSHMAWGKTFDLGDNNLDERALEGRKMARSVAAAMTLLL